MWLCPASFLWLRSPCHSDSLCLSEPTAVHPADPKGKFPHLGHYQLFLFFHPGVQLIMGMLSEKPRSGTPAEVAACERVQQKAAVTLARLSRDPDVAREAVRLSCKGCWLWREWSGRLGDGNSPDAMVVTEDLEQGLTGVSPSLWVLGQRCRLQPLVSFKPGAEASEWKG